MPVSLFHRARGTIRGTGYNLSCPFLAVRSQSSGRKDPSPPPPACPPHPRSFPSSSVTVLRASFPCFGNSGSILHVLVWKLGRWEAHWPHWSALHQSAILPSVQSGNGSNHLPLDSRVDRARAGPCSTWGWEDTCIEPGPGQWMRALMRYHIQDAFHRDRNDL